MKKMHLGLQQSQKQILSPQLQQGIKLLQMSSLELAEVLEQEISQNPFLEEELEELREGVDGGIDGGIELSEAVERGDISKGISKEEALLEGEVKGGGEGEDERGELVDVELFEETSDSGYYSRQNSSKPKEESFNQEYIKSEGTEERLSEYLLTQLRFVEGLTEREYFIGEVIISSLNDDGYLLVSVESLSKSLNEEKAVIEGMIKKIQTFEPSGVCGRNLAEVLLIQLKGKGERREFIINLVKNDLHLLEKKRYKELSIKYKVSQKELDEALTIIGTLEPIPGRGFYSEQTKYISPDVKIEHSSKDIGGRYIITLNDGYAPNIRINVEYKSLLNGKDLNVDTKSYFKEKYNEAKFLITSIEKRKATMLKVMEQLVMLQDDFLKKGARYLRPLVLKDIAERINMHESTVSRVVSNKYVETPWGIYELKYLFSGGIGKGTNIISSRSIKEVIKGIIANEGTKESLSDQKIAEILKKQGIEIARRTVSKYRKKLKIESSYNR